MKRIISVLAAMGLMAAMLAASAMPAFAAVKVTQTGNLPDCFTFNGAVCSGTITTVGGSGEKGGGSGGKSTVDITQNKAVDPAERSSSLSGSSQGGGKDTGGGNCTKTFDSETDPAFSTGGNGSRCDDQRPGG